MRKIILYSFVCFSFLSCKKEEVFVITPSSSATVELKIEQVVNDSTIVLKWTKYTAPHFKQYRLVRTANYFSNGKFENAVEVIDSSNNADHIQFTENKMPFARNVFYSLFVIDDSMRIKATGRVTYQRPNSLFDGVPKDVLIDKQLKRLYVTETNKITIMDYNSGRIILTRDFPVSIGLCSQGSFNGVNELYVPVNDGWLQIMNASTLDLIDRVYVGGFGIGSVVAVNGKLFVSSSDMGMGGYSHCIKIYERATKQFIGRTGEWDRTRLLPLEGTSIEMVELTLNLAPTDLNYYQFSMAGMPLLYKDDSYHGDFLMDAYVARSFPDGSKFITSSSGTIFNKSLVFDRYLKQYGNFTDFAFNADGSVIYAADGIKKTIDAIAYPSTTLITSYPTSFFPYKIFRDESTIICVSKSTNLVQNTYLTIEKINL